MKLSEKDRTKVIVVGVVTLLAIGVFASYYFLNRPVVIEVEEGEAEKTITYIGEDEQVKNLGMNETAETTVENHGTLKFEVEARSIIEYPTSQDISLELEAIGDFGEELDLENFKFKAVESEENEDVPNHIDFMMSRSDIDNGEAWPPSENVGGVRSIDPDHPAYVGYDLESNEFKIQNEILWGIREENVGEDFTLEIQAVVDGQISEKIVSTVLVHIEEKEGDPFTVFYILCEEGKADDYPSDLEVGEYGTITAGVTNHEYEQIDYELLVGLGEEYEEMEYKGELPPDQNITFSSNNTYYSTDISLKHGEEWNQTMSFSIDEPGTYKLPLFLLRDGEVYRSVHI